VTARLIFALGAIVSLAGQARATALLDDLDHSRDEAEASAGAVAVALLLDDAPALRVAARRIEALDERREDAGLRPTGLDDEIQLCAAALAPSRAARRTALNDVIDDSDGELRRLALGLRAGDDTERAARLLTDDRHDRRASLLNEAIRPFGLGTNLLALVNPVLLAGSALDSVISTTRNVLRYDRLSTREREALARYHTAVDRDASSERSPELARATRKLGAKRRAALCKAAVRAADEALDDGALARAATNLRQAEQLEDCDDGLEKQRERLDEARREEASAYESAIWPATEAALPRTPAEESAWRSLAVAVVEGDAGRIDAAADRLIAIDDDGPLVPGAELSRALALQLRGRHGDVEDALDELADDDTPVGQYARGVLDGPGFGEGDALAAAERAHRLKVARFVAIGGTSGTTALQGAAHVAAYGATGAQTLGIANAIGMLTRAWRAWRHDPIPNDSIISRGEEYLVRHPTAADGDDIRERLAGAYERAERYDRALLHTRAMQTPDADDVERLEDKLADQMLERARRQDADPSLLGAIVEHLPETDAATTAREALEKMSVQGNGVTLTREQLVRHRDLLGPDGLDLRPGLLDGDDANGELADDGLTVRPQQVELRLAGEDDAPRVDTRPLEPDEAQRLFAAAEALLYREALDRKEPGDERGRFEDYIPIFITGTVGDSGVNMYPGIKLRRYDPAHPERYQ